MNFTVDSFDAGPSDSSIALVAFIGNLKANEDEWKEASEMILHSHLNNLKANEDEWNGRKRRSTFLFLQTHFFLHCI